MANEPKNGPDVRQVHPALSFFLKHLTPDFSLESCADSLILTIAQYVTSNQIFGFLWDPARRATSRTRLTLYNGNVVHALVTEKKVPPHEPEKEYRTDLRVLIHNSSKSILQDPGIRHEIEEHGNRSAIEIRFSYYGRPLLWVVLGFPNQRQIPSEAVQEFLLIFCRCCLVSLHGAYIAAIEEHEGRRDTPQVEERFNRTLQWLHSLVRHLNVGISTLQDGELDATDDALERASIVAGVCLAEILALMGDIRADRPLDPSKNENSDPEQTRDS
jgi:hypothetical protein